MQPDQQTLIVKQKENYDNGLSVKSHDGYRSMNEQIPFKMNDQRPFADPSRISNIQTELKWKE